MRLRRILLAAITCIALAVAALHVFGARDVSFRGRLAVGLNHRERIAVAHETVPGVITSPDLISSTRGSQIPFEDRETAFKVFSESTDYDAFKLPFSVRLDKIDVVSAPPVRHMLTVSEGQTNETIEVAQDSETFVTGVPYRVTCGPWSGLIRDPQGVPMAALTLRVGGAAGTDTTVLLASDKWQAAPGGSALYFAWHASAEAAQAAAAAPTPGLETARWGVVDRGAINWFQSFTPGTGAVLSTGEEVTLINFNEDKLKPAVAVEIKRGDQKRTAWVVANQPEESVPVRFECLALAPHVFMLHAWEDAHALVTGNGKQKELRQRQWFHAEPAEINVRLDDVFSNAVPVTDSKLWAAVLKPAAGDEIVLREGEARQTNDARVQYIRKHADRVVNYTFTIDGRRQHVLKPGKTIRVGRWQLRQAPNECDPNTVAVFEADYAAGSWKTALLFAAIGLTALALQPTARKQPRR